MSEARVDCRLFVSEDFGVELGTKAAFAIPGFNERRVHCLEESIQQLCHFKVVGGEWVAAMMSGRDVEPSVVAVVSIGLTPIGATEGRL
jgi:hypothetical protein